MAYRALVAFLLVFLSGCKSREQKKIPIKILGTKPPVMSADATPTRRQLPEVKLGMAPKLKLEVARRSLYTGDLDTARKLLEELAQTKDLPKELKAAVLAALGEVYFTADENEKALVTLMKSAALKPDDPFVHHLMGLTYERLGRKDRALEELREALRIAPDELAARLDYISMLTERGASKDEIAKQARMYFSEREKLVNILREGKDPSAILRALEILDQVPEPVPSDAILPLLEHSDVNIRIRAGYVAGRYPRGKKVLQEKLKDEKDPRVKEAWRLAIRYGRPLVDKEAGN